MSPRSPRTSRCRTIVAVTGVAAGIVGGVLLAPAASALEVAPSAGLLGATCEQGGSLLHLENPGAEPVPFTVAVDGRGARIVELPAGAVHDEVVPIADGAEATVRVDAPGMATVEATVEQRCAAAEPVLIVATQAAPAAVLGVPGGEPSRAGTVAVALVHLVLAIAVRGFLLHRRHAA